MGGYVGTPRANRGRLRPDKKGSDYHCGVRGLFYHVARFRVLRGFFLIRGRGLWVYFLIATGFHGLHVLVGTLFLLVCLLRHFKREFRAAHHFGFEAAAWY